MAVKYKVNPWNSKNLKLGFSLVSLYKLAKPSIIFLMSGVGGQLSDQAGKKYILYF